MRKTVLTIAGATVLAAACETPPGTANAASPLPAGQKWICGREYVNHAWGYQRRSEVLDANGHVWRYNVKSIPNALIKPWNPVDPSSMTTAELEQRYAGATDLGARASQADIARNALLIAEAANTKPTEGSNVGADMGSSTIFCYRFDEASGRYSEVLLDLKGDWVRTNPSPAAKSLVAWLGGIFVDPNRIQ